jgi:hypothetical protein
MPVRQRVASQRSVNTRRLASAEYAEMDGTGTIRKQSGMQLQLQLNYLVQPVINGIVVISNKKLNAKLKHQ